MHSAGANSCSGVVPRLFSKTAAVQAGPAGIADALRSVALAADLAVSASAVVGVLC